MSNRPAVVIIPVWNGRDYLPRCLDALLAQTYAPMTVIAVDNASDDGSADLIAQRYPGVTLLRQGQNLGFAGACNAGMRAAEADALRVILNQDTEVRPGWLQALADALSAEDAGLAGSKALYPDGTIQHAGATLDPHVGGRHIGVHEADDGRFDAPGEPDFLSGVSLAITPAAYAAAGELDEGFVGAYFEDVDWCYRVRAAGFRLAYAPDSVLVHHEESRAHEESFDAIFRYQRNRLRLLLKHWSMARLRDDFLPAEQAWLGRQLSATFVSAVQSAYSYHLFHLDEMMAWRESFLGDRAGTLPEAADLLVTLRLTYTTGPAFPPAGGLPDDGAHTATRVTQLLRELDAEAAAPLHWPRSTVPLLGPGIDGLRRIWSRLAADPAVYAELARARRMNATLRNALAELEAEQRRLADLSVAYAQVNARETALLLAEVRTLMARRQPEE